ncbi:hypothetical protein HYU17_00610 [Candidatus Woesearchaeota archaeon]|nr:hypothetical protein [Candidatus Woesearchaeota archaeon]
MLPVLKRLNKKGLENETIVLLAVVVAMILLSFKFMGGVAEASESSADATACKGSVQRNANLHIRGFEFPAAIECPAQDIKITKTSTPSAQEKAKRRIANAMYDCWNNFGEGKLNLFIDEATYCTVCAFIDIRAGEPVAGLSQYLMDEEIPDRSGRLYIDYLSSFKTSKAEQVLGTLKNTPLLGTVEKGELKKGTYASIFVYAKGEDQIAEVARHLTAQTAEGKAGLVIGVGGGALAAGGTMLAVASIGVVAGPPGWVVLGAGAAAFGVFYGMSEAVSFLTSRDNVPEWAAFTVLREWNGVNSGSMLKNEIGCTYYPAELEKR